MPTKTHTHGEPQGVGDILRTDLRGILERQRQRTADNRWAHYVKPIGNDRHLVKNPDNAQAYVVGSSYPGLSFAPGSVVLLASNASHPGEIAIGMPSTSRRGGFTHPVKRFKPSHSATEAGTGSSYLAIHITTSGTAYAWRYVDGTWQEKFGELDFSGVFTGTIDGQAMLSSNPKVYAFAKGFKIVVWNIDTGTSATVDRTGAHGVTFALRKMHGDLVTRRVYWIERQTASPQRHWLVSADVTGAVTQHTTEADPGPVVSPVVNGAESGFEFWTGTSMIAPVYDTDGAGAEKDGFIETKLDGTPPAKVESSTWLEVETDTGDWLNYQEGHRVPGTVKALTFNWDTGYVGTVDAQARWTKLIPEGWNLGDPNDLLSWAPSVNGSEMVILRDDNTVRRFSLAVQPSTDPDSSLWLAVDPDPDTALQPGFMGCLD